MATVYLTMYMEQPDSRGNEQDNKASQIGKIIGAGLQVGHVIHRHGMEDEETAHEVEAALMDAYPGLTNIGSPVGSDRSSMHAKEIIELYGSEPAEIREPVILFSVTRTVLEEGLSIYEAVRWAWNVDMAKAMHAELVLAVVKGMIRGAFVVDEWLRTDDAHEHFPDRPAIQGKYGFVGGEACQEIKHRYVGKRAPRLYGSLRYNYEVVDGLPVLLE